MTDKQSRNVWTSLYGTFQYLCTHFKTSKGALIMKRYGYYNPKGRYLDEESSSIWLNEQENVYILDCGCGLPNGRLASICLENGERFYT